MIKVALKGGSGGLWRHASSVPDNGKIQRIGTLKTCRHKLLSPLLGLCLLLIVAAPATATTYGDIDVNLQSQPKDKSRHGYFEYVFLVANRSAEETHTIALSMPDQEGYTGVDHIRELRRTVRVGPGESARVPLLQPDYPHVGGEDVTVFVDGHRQEHAVVLQPNGTQRGGRYYRGRGGYGSHFGTTPEPLVLKSLSIEKSFPRADPPVGEGMSVVGIPTIGPGATPAPALDPAKPAADPAKSSPGPPAPKIGVPAHTQFPLAQPIESWSDNWLAYSRYDGIIVKADDLKAMAPNVRVALWQYVETGGSLLVLGDADLPGLSINGTKKTERGWRAIEAGFGQCLVSPDERVECWKKADFDRLTKSWAETSGPWEGRRDIYDANEKFPVVDDIGVPIKGLFLLMLLFTLAIGPINFLVLARKKRRIWMLWTTPAISLVTCLAVFAYMLLSEGWEGRLRTETLTLLDERTNRATTIGWTAVYSPLTPGDGLHFAYETEVVPQKGEQMRGTSVASCVIDWSRDQHFASGWIEARVPAHFRVRKSETRRERVAVHREADGTWSIVNGLGVEIRRFSYVDEKELLYTAENVAAGARAILTPKNKGSVPMPETMRSIFFNPSWPTRFQELGAVPQRGLRPRSYLAEVDDSPFLEDALRNAKTRKCRALIVGFLTEAVRE